MVNDSIIADVSCSVVDCQRMLCSCFGMGMLDTLAGVLLRLWRGYLFWWLLTIVVHLGSCSVAGKRD